MRTNKIDVKGFLVLAVVFTACGLSFADDRAAMMEKRREHAELRAIYHDGVIAAAREAHERAPESITEPMLPASHDRRFMLPRDRWEALYCAKHQSATCDALGAK